MIEGIFDFLDHLACECIKRDFLREVLSDEPIGMFIEPSLPGVIKSGKEAKYPSLSLEVRSLVVEECLDLQASHGLTLRGLTHFLDAREQDRGMPAVEVGVSSSLDLWSQVPKSNGKLIGAATISLSGSGACF